MVGEVIAGKISVLLGLDSSGLKTGLDQAKADLTGWRDETNKGIGSVVQWGAAIGATIAPIAAAGYAAYATIEKFGGMAQELQDLSYQTGISTDYLQRLQYASVLSGDSFSTASFGVNKLTLQMGQFANGSKEAIEAFQQIGVTPTGKSVEKVFDEIAIAITRIEDPTKRVAAATALFGRNGKEMLPFMDDYIKNLEKIKGLSTLSPEELEANVQAKQTLDDLAKKWENLEAKMVSYFTKQSTKWDESLEKIRGLGGQSGKGSISAIDRYLFGMQEDMGIQRGADRDPDQTLRKGGSTTALIDKYSGLDEAGLRYQISLDELTAAEGEYTKALSGTQEELDIAGRKLQEVQLAHEALRKEMATTAMEGQTAALKDLQEALKDVGAEQQRLADMNRDYAENVQFAGADVSQIRRLTMAHNQDLRNEGSTMSALQQRVSESAKGAGSKAGDLVVNIDGKMVAKIPGVVAGGITKSDRIQRGYVTSS